MIRDSIETCTGHGGINVEDSRDYCIGWKHLRVDGSNENCTESDEYKYTTAKELEAIAVPADIRNYGGGGYIFKLNDQIGALDAKETVLKLNNWYSGHLLKQ